MVTAAKAGLGTTLARAGYTIAEGIEIGDFEGLTEIKDVTSHDSGGLKEFIPLLREYSDMLISGNFIAGDTNGQIGLQADWAAGTLQTFVLTLPTSVTATVSFSAYVTKINIGGFNLTGNQTFSATLKISGSATLAIGASTGLTTPFFVISESAVITPAAAGDVFEYGATVLTAIASVTVTPTAAAGVITVNGSIVATGVPSGAIALGAAGSRTVVTIVVTETAKVAKTYEIWVLRAAA